MTRVATYQLASEGGTAPTNNLSKRIGLTKDLHQLSHSAAKDADGLQRLGPVGSICRPAVDLLHQAIEGNERRETALFSIDV